MYGTHCAATLVLANIGGLLPMASAVAPRVVSTPRLAFSDRVVDAHEPVLVRAIRLELAVENLDERVVGRRTRAAEVKCGAASVSPQVRFGGNQLAALVDVDRLMIAHPFEYLYHVRRPKAEPRHDRQ